MCCGNKDNGGDLVEGNRYDVIYVHPSRGKKIVTGMKTKERLGYIAYGAVILNVHETDIAAQQNLFTCATCAKPFSVQGEKSWCNTCHPLQKPVTPQLAQMAPRHASERLLASTRKQAGFEQGHPRFTGQQPNARQGIAPTQRGGPQAPINAPQVQPGQQPAMPPPPGQSDVKSVVAEAKQKKAQAFGIPVVEPGALGPPPDLSGQEQSTDVQEYSPPIAELDLGRSVNSRHVRILKENGVVTLADAHARGRKDLIAIKNIGPSVADTLIAYAER
jgi:hypothetical protein